MDMEKGPEREDSNKDLEKVSDMDVEMEDECHDSSSSHADTIE